VGEVTRDLGVFSGEHPAGRKEGGGKKEKLKGMLESIAKKICFWGGLTCR
jgi:hypothetical protein